MERDCLEDYLELSEKISKDANKAKRFAVTSQKRIQCERKALGIVQLFLERSVNPDIFLKSIVHLNPSYYEDVAEERALLKLCGYPLCRKKISKLKNRYSICNKSKKVYDLNDYGNFCSIFCFNASNHIKSQILDSPLWLRDLDDVPTFSLLVKKESHAAGIDIKLKKPKKKEEFTPTTSFAVLSLQDVGNINFSVPVLAEKQVESSSKKSNTSKLPTVMENEEEDVKNVDDKPHGLKSNVSAKQLECTDNSIEMERQKGTKGLNDKISCPSLSTQNNKENLRNSRETTRKSLCLENKLKNTPQLKDLRAITNKIKSKNKKSLIPIIPPLPLNTKTSDVMKLQENKHETQCESMKNKSLIELKFSFKDSGNTIEKSIKNIFKSWVTLETLMFVHGENTIKEILDVNKLSEHFERLKVSQLEIGQQHKYISICRRLCEQEIFEEKIDSLLVENKVPHLPDYKQLKQKSKEFNSKVNTFFNGDLHETTDKNFGTVREKQTPDTDNETTFIPLDDVHSQNTLRQQILLKTLKNSIEFFLDYLEYDSTSVFTDLNELVKSFKLNAENIVFKLIIRNYLGLICLKILALKDAKLGQAVEKTEFLELENSVFEQLPGNKEVLMNSMKLINDVDNFIETYVKSTDS